MKLNKEQKKYLIGICHHIKPVVMLGQKGLTETVMQEIHATLEQHELIKIKLRGDRESREQWAAQIEQKTQAQLVQKIGQVGCFYKKHPKEPKLALP